jgi:O-antigen/teichoic acid export membrane protein
MSGSGKSTVASRLKGTFAAFGLAQMLALGLQILVLPILTGAWGKSVYADWLIIATVPAYLTIADFGFGLALGNELGILWAADRLKEASQIYEAAWTVVSGSWLCFSLGFLAFIHVAPIERWLNLKSMPSGVTTTLLTLFMLQVLMSQLIGVLRAPFRTQGLAGRAQMIVNMMPGGQIACVALVATFHGTPLVLAASYNLVAFGVLATLWVRGARDVPWLRPRFRRVRWPEIKGLVKPGIGMNLMTMGTAFSVQGTLLAVSVALGPESALVFSATRTMTRLVNQLTNMVESSFTPEFSTAIAAGDHALAKKLHHRASQVSLWVAITVSTGMLLVAKPLYTTWSRHQLPFEYPLFIVLLLAVVVNGGYWGSMAAPISTNKILGMSVWYCGGAAVLVGVSWFACRMIGTLGAALSVFGLEVFMLCVVVPMAIRIVHDNFGEWLRAMLVPDFGWLLRRRSRT